MSPSIASIPLVFLGLAQLGLLIQAHPLNTSNGTVTQAGIEHASAGVRALKAQSSNCFPAVGFTTPSTVPASTEGWWCDESTEYAFVGFSYEVTACQSSAQLQKDFADIRKRFKGRYVRLYGVCDNEGFYDDIVDAAWANSLGVHALIWFGYDGDSKWKTRRDTLVSSLHSNPKAKFVTRVVQFGSEPLFDQVLPQDQLADQVNGLKGSLKGLGVKVTVSDMAYGYQSNDNAPDVINAVDFFDIHMLPYFSQQASTAKNAWPLVKTDLDWFVKNGEGKKIYMSENGWPSEHYTGVEPNSPNAVSDVSNEQDYYTLLDDHCTDFKNVAGGGVGWFAHIYSDNMEPGYGIYGTDGKLKFPFAPRTSC